MNLHEAVRQGDVLKIRQLLAGGAAVDERDRDGSTPLITAIRHSEGEAFQALLEAGADVNASNPQGMTVLAAAAAQGTVSMVRKLIAQGADVHGAGPGGLPLLISAVAGAGLSGGGYDHVVFLLLAAGADPKAKDKDGKNALNWAKKLDQADLVKLLNAPIPKVREAKPTAASLFQAAATGDVEEIQKCLAAGLAIDSRNAEGCTPLMLAAQANKRHAIEVLLAAGADAFAEAANGYNTLLLAANSVIAIRQIHRSGINLNHQTQKRGLTPVMFAAQQGFLEVVRYLVEAGVDLSLKTRSGEDAVERARMAGQQKAVAYLKEKLGIAVPARPGGPKQPKAAKKPSETGQLFKAARAGDVVKIRELLAQGVSLEVRDREDYTPLMAAAFNKQPESLRVLLEAGADPKAACGGTGADALYLAAGQGHLEMVQALIDRGASVNPRPDRPGHCGFTPLMAAAMSGNLKLVKLLVDAGADPKVETFGGDSAVKWARQQGHKEVVKYLKELIGPKPAMPQKPLPEPAVPADPKKPGQVLKAVVLNFPIAAAQTAFQAARQVLEQRTGKAPTESAKRPGVFLQALGRKTIDRLANHYQLPKPAYDDDHFDEDRDGIEEMVDRLQAEVRGHGFSLILAEATWGPGDPIKLRLYPTADPYAVLAACGTNGNNHGLNTGKVVRWLRSLEKAHPFILTACGHDFLAGKFLKPVADAAPLARRMYAFCPDIVDQGTETVQALARELKKMQEFFFWWD